MTDGAAIPVAVHHGDCRDVLRQLAADGLRVDAVVTDPPYHLTSIVERFGADDAAPTRSEGATGVYARASAGFMGKKWDGGDVAFRAETWRAVAALMKPGAHLVAFGGTRTYHRLACAIEDAGFEVRDMLSWLYGSGFPKSHDVGKGIDKALGAVRAVRAVRASPNGFGGSSGIYSPMAETAAVTDPATEDAARWDGWGTALKPACEPIVLARLPMADRTVAANVLRHSTGALNIDGCRVPAEPDRYAPGDHGVDGRARRSGFALGAERVNDKGRWPANVLHDGTDELLAMFPRTESGTGAVRRATGAGYQGHALGVESRPAGTPNVEYGDAGSAARFFYSAKADAEDRAGSNHPTVKPVALLRWLVRLVTPPGGLILDPFAGTGTTGVAALREGMRAVLIEREDEYVADIRRRLAKLDGSDAPLFSARPPNAAD